jgi:proton-translocating NADH-quinone oxidoreductase chain N
LFDSLYFFNQKFQLIFLFSLLLVALTSRDFLISKTIAKLEYEILFLFVMLSSICLCFADDFLTFYLAIELQSLAFYVFATFNRNSEFCTEAGLKYFVFGAIISCFLLLGFCFIYFAYGSVNFEIIYSLILEQNDAFLFIGIVFILIPLLFKIGSAPFHSWLCDVYDGSILTVTLLFASAPKIILFGVIVKLFYFLFNEFQIFSNYFFIYSAVGSIFIGSISALYQKRIKRLFAYSTITHTGFILLAIVAASVESVKAIVFYTIIYSLLSILLFSILIFSVVVTNNYPKYLIN